MKKILSTILLFGIFLLVSQGQDTMLSVSGNVFDEATGAGIQNHLVTAQIMNAGTIETYEMMTNDAGFYGDSIPVFSQGSLEVFTIDCIGEIHSFTDFFNPGNYSFNYDFIICGDSLPSGCNSMFEYFIPPVGGNTVFFSNLSTGNPTDWIWDFGDGTTSGEWEPIHDFANPGTYSVCLIIWSNDSSCYDMYCEDIAVGNGGGDCENFFWYETWNMIDFTFMGESLPVPADYYYWDFGDGNTGEGQTVLHTYDPVLNDVVIVTLTTLIFDPATGDSCVATSSQDVWVGTQGGDCSNWFWYDTYDSFTFDFTGDGMPPASAYFWDFGDGNTGSGQNAQHTYDESYTGEVMVTLTTFHTIGGAADTCVAYSNQIVFVGDSTVGCENFFWYQPTGDYSFIFTGEAYPPADLYTWDFGDGQTASGQEVQHTFSPNMGDVFVVTLNTMSYNPAGDTCFASSTQEVWINNGGWDCENWFWYDTWDFITYDFIGESFPFPADEYYWDFGDGNNGMGQAITHTYNAGQGEVFLVTLTTFGFDPMTGDSCIAISEQEVTIGGNTGDCENMFWYESGNEFTFDFFGEAFPFPADYYSWDFGDGTTASGQNVSHTFDSSLGNLFLVCLTTYSVDPAGGDSCVAESCQEIYLGGQSGVEIFGTIYADNNPVDVALVGLFGADPNMFYFDFTLTQPGTGSYFFGNVPEGDYYIFTSLTPQSELFYDYFPTYYGDAIFWFEAELISFGDPSNPYDINLVPITSVSYGPGTISGTVTMEDGKEGPGENITIMLMDENENPMNFAHSNEAGEFTFENLAYGIYKLKVEMPSVNSETAIVDLNENNQVSELHFYVQNNSAYLGIDDQLSAVSSIGEIYPNPVSSTASLQIETLERTEIVVQIISQTGNVIKSYPVRLNKGDGILEIETSSLNSGFYYIQLIGGNGNSIARKFIK